MHDWLTELNSPLFEGIKPEEMMPMMHCIGYRISHFSKGEIVAFEGENLKHIGIVLFGSVDMVKEDLWGNKTMLVRMQKDEMFGETFACGTGACAVAVAACENGFWKKGEDIKVKLLGGDLIINYTDDTVYMTGNAEKVFEGEVEV